MELAKEYIDFLNKCPTPFHFGQVVSEILLSNGYTELKENEEWLEIPEKGFLLRDGRALIAWQNGGLDKSLIVGTHDDSPCFKLKPNFEISSNGYLKCSTSSYGGGLWYTWMDRELRLAGRVYVQENGEIVPKLFDSITPIAVIPSKGPHFDETHMLSPKFDLDNNFQPIYGFSEGKTLTDYISEKLNISPSQIVDF